ncbi:peptidase [Segetibacter sp. 3557_3]|uniref:M14 family metallopeptidase n=1 Tax=Segetibacter sp. 3557_3 TaxID=2547429 RepID=UPI0010586212|nr:M14 metallopeptidase family protein [Segetibacter sp. 3557_3]TDH21425.1 peptidase [Segetibacter sp. 3557_3]
MIRLLCFVVLLVVVQLSSSIRAQDIPSPKSHFGFDIGDDYKLATYTQTEAYFKKLAEASDRIKLVEIGKTEEGRHQYMLIVSAPETLKNLDHFKSISQKLAHADQLTDAQAGDLAAEGKAVVWIDGGLHATEVVGIHQLIETIYQVVSRNDRETGNILKNTIILFTHANPDGQELVSNWYMSQPDVKKRNTNIPRLYQKYIGHDNNRDFFMMNMKETQNITRQQYVEWIPQIVYNHHQTGPPGSVVAGPPYRDPFNYAFDPLIITSLDEVGAAMNNRLNREGKPGYTQRAGSVFSTWWNGGLRTTPYFHNMIGLLTEIIGNPTPSKIPLVPGRLIPNGATPNPIKPQDWHFRQSIDYSVSLNYAVLNYAVNNRENLLYGIYKMGKNAIEKGSKDHWSFSPKYIDSIAGAFRKDPKNSKAGEGTVAARLSLMDTIPARYYDSVYSDRTFRDPRAYILSSAQPDFPTATQFINALIRSGVQVHTATSAFNVAGKIYPTGSYVVKTAQAFRPHILDMFEPQDHPNDFLYPGGPPVRPYDAAGWTLAYTMGVQFDRVLDGFDAPLQAIAYGELQTPQGRVDAGSGAAGYLLDSRVNRAFVVVNDLLAGGAPVYRLAAAEGKMKAGDFFVPAGGKAAALLQKSAAGSGISVTAVSKRPAVQLKKVSPLRIALWDVYGGSMPSGWVRWLMEQYHFAAQVVYAPEINTANLAAKYDVIVFVTGAIPPLGRGEPGRGNYNRMPNPQEVPEEFRPHLGRLNADTTIPQLQKFLTAGGRIVTIGSSTNLAYHLKLPVRHALTEVVAGEERTLPGEKYYIPGSILRASIDSVQMPAWGMASAGDIYFDASPVFKVAPESIANGSIKPLMWFSSNKPLRSGWAWGQTYLQDGIAAFSAKVGKGTLYAFSPEITFRGQTHGTFKLLFNQLYGLE